MEELTNTDVLVAKLLIPALGAPGLADALRRFAALVDAS